MNEFIVWDKLPTKFGFGKVVELNENTKIKIEFKDENGKEFYKYREQGQVSFHRPIGKTDDTPEKNKIYADSSIVEAILSREPCGKRAVQGWFSYSTELLSYEFCFFTNGINDQNYVELPQVEKVTINLSSYDDYVKITNLKIIDTIQENKLGLIK